MSFTQKLGKFSQIARSGSLATGWGIKVPARKFLAQP